MFSFHKNDVPRSRQSSVDSQATGTHASAFGQDPWTDQRSMSTSHGGAHSPEQHHRFNPARRSSVFNLRSRSNTATSLTPSLLALGQHDMADHESSWHDKAHQSSTSRRSLFRGKKGKRLSETGVIGGDEHEEVSDRRTSLLRKSRRGTNQSEDSCKWLCYQFLGGRPTTYLFLLQLQASLVASLLHLTFNTSPIPTDTNSLHSSKLPAIN